MLLNRKLHTHVYAGKKVNMKTMRKLWTLFLSLALMLSLVTGIPVTANAEETTGDITVTLRVEQDYSTVLAPVNVTLTESDKAKDFGLSGLEGTNSPLKALAKYLSTEKNVSDDDMSKYINVSSGGFLNSISWNGKDVTNPCETMLDGTSFTQYTAWSYSVKNGDNTNAEGDKLITQYELKDNDSISICGLFSEFSADYSSTLAGFSSSFDQDQYAASTGKAINVTLNQNNFGVRSACEGATILAAKLSDTVLTATKDNASVTASTDKEGKASLTFKEAGTYVLSAYKTASDKIHSTISRPYAVVTVSAADVAKDPNPDKKNTISSTLPAVTPVQVSTAVMPAKVKSLKAKVPKNKKTKKSVKFTWKKAKNATAYQIYISKKKKSGYKKQATTTSLKKTLKLKKGTYYVKVRAYNKSGSFYKYGKFSTVLKVKVKNKK